MKNRHETYRGIAKKKLDLSDFLADGQEVDEALSELYDHRMFWVNDPFETFATQVTPGSGVTTVSDEDEPDWDELGRIAEMEDFAERGLGLY